MPVALRFHSDLAPSLPRSARKSITLEGNTRDAISACTACLQLVLLFEAYLITVPATTPCVIDLGAAHRAAASCHRGRTSTFQPFRLHLQAFRAAPGSKLISWCVWAGKL